MTSSNRIVVNALASNDLAGAGAFMAGWRASEAMQKANEARKAKAKGVIGHAYRDLTEALSILDPAVQSGDSLAAETYRPVSTAIALLSKLMR